MSLFQVVQKTLLGLALVVPFTSALPQLPDHRLTSYNVTTSRNHIISSPTAGSTGLPQGTVTPNVTDTCRSGNRYTVVSGDNCQTISIAQSVGTRELNLINNIRPDCTNLILGGSICLPGRCKIYTVQIGDDCTAIAARQNTTFNDILRWNPTIDFQCGNLIGGESLCVSPPAGGVSISPNVTVTVPIRTAAPTSVNGTATVAAGPVSLPTSVVQPLGPVPPATDKSSCLEYHTVVSGDTCFLVAMQYETTFDQLGKLNPDIDAKCTNLLLGVSYCVQGA